MQKNEEITSMIVLTHVGADKTMTRKLWLILIQAVRNSKRTQSWRRFFVRIRVEKRKSFARARDKTRWRLDGVCDTTRLLLSALFHFGCRECYLEKTKMKPRVTWKRTRKYTRSQTKHGTVLEISSARQREEQRNAAMIYRYASLLIARICEGTFECVRLREEKRNKWNVIRKFPDNSSSSGFNSWLHHTDWSNSFWTWSIARWISSSPWLKCIIGLRRFSSPLRRSSRSRWSCTRVGSCCFACADWRWPGGRSFSSIGIEIWASDACNPLLPIESRKSSRSDDDRFGGLLKARLFSRELAPLGNERISSHARLRQRFMKNLIRRPTMPIRMSTAGMPTPMAMPHFAPVFIVEWRGSAVVLASSAVDEWMARETEETNETRE